MRLEQLRQVDLNLLVTFAVVAEEKSITAAASRLLLSQPAVSRALQRARLLFDDDLLVRSAEGFEPTPRGRKILQELESLFPIVKRLVAPAEFHPKRERGHFRISGPDNACAAVLPGWCRQYAHDPYQVTLDFLPWQSDAADLLDHGKLDLLIHIDDGLLPSHFQSARLYRENWICVVPKESRVRYQLSLKEYLAADHIVVSTLSGVQSIPDKQMAALGVKRRSLVRVPYFGAAIHCLRGTGLVLTMTSGMQSFVERDAGLRIVKAPEELKPFHFLMVWHPRVNTDTRHSWLRGAIRSSVKRLQAEVVK